MADPAMAAPADRLPCRVGAFDFGLHEHKRVRAVKASPNTSMKLSALFETSGSWLFRYRSFLPLCAAPILIAGLDSFEYLDGSHLKTELWGAMCFVISLLGLVVRVFTVGHVPKRTSGRNTRAQVAQVLNTTGIYSVMRHPLYLGNYLAMIGFVVFLRSPWLVLLATSLFALYYERIMFAEEAFLSGRFGQDFEQWAARTPAILPRLSRWVPSVQRFSWRSALRREYTGVLLVLGGFSLLDAVADSVAEARWHVDRVWAGLLAGALIIYCTLRALKKHTNLLHVEGR